MCLLSTRNPFHIDYKWLQIQIQVYLLDIFPAISSHPTCASPELPVMMPRLTESTRAAQLVGTQELTPHRASGPMICPLSQWLEKNKLQSRVISQKENHKLLAKTIPTPASSRFLSDFHGLPETLFF